MKALKYQDICLVPNYTECHSRSDCNTEVNLCGIKFNLPIIPANMKSVIDMAADRGAFIDQSQSMNLWMEDPNYKTLTSMHFYGWKKGLKTGQYYLRRKPKHNPQQFTIDPNKKMTTGEKTNITDSSNNNLNNTSNNDECEMCGS